MQVSFIAVEYPVLFTKKKFASLILVSRQVMFQL